MSHPTLITIEEVEQAFAIWRSNKKGNPPIPDALWNQVTQLLMSYGRGEVLRRLGLTTQQAKDKGLISVNHRTAAPASSPFVQIAIPTAAVQTVIPRSSSLTLQRGDTQLCLNHPSDEQIQLIINTLLRQIRCCKLPHNINYLWRLSL